MIDRPLWTPPELRRQNSNLATFIERLRSGGGPALDRYRDAHTYSVAEPAHFWSALWDFAEIKAADRGSSVFVPGASMPEARFFPEARLNYAENLLVRNDEGVALVFRGEDRVERRMSWRELQGKVTRLHHALAASGLKPGDRVAAIVPNHPDTIVCFLAVASLGAIWSSCSPDFGERGILDRFGQIEPRVLIGCDGYFYNGKTIPLAARIGAVLEHLPSVEEVILIDYIGQASDVSRSLRN